MTIQKAIDAKLENLDGELELHKTIYRMAEDTALISSVLWHLPDGHMTWSDSFYALMGYRRDSVESLKRLFIKSIHPGDRQTVTHIITQALNHQEQESITFRLITKSGVRTIRMMFRHIAVAHKEAVIGLLQDITQQRVTEEQLAGQLRLSDLIYNAVPDMLLLTNLNHTVTQWNEEAVRKTGISRKEALHRNLFDLFPQLKEGDYFTHLQKALAGEKVSGTQDRNVYVATVHDYYLLPHTDDNGTLTGLLHLIHDATKEQELHQRLSDRLNFIEGLADASVDRFIVLDRHMNYLYWNHKAEEYYSISRQRVLGKNILEIFPSFRNDPSYQEFRRVLKGQTVHIPATVTEDSNDYFETYLIPIKNGSNEITGILWITHDLSKEHQLQQQTKQKQELLQATMDSSMDMIQVFEAVRNEEGAIIDFKYVLLNHEAEKWMPDVIGKRLLQTQPGVVEEGIFDAFKQVVETGIPKQYEKHYVHEQFNGWFYQSVVKLNDGVATTTTNITERKKAGQELATAKERLQVVLDSSLYSIQAFKDVRNEAGKIVDFVWIMNNRKATEQNGEAIGKSLLKENPGILPSGLFDKFVAVTQTGVAVDQEVFYNYEPFKGWYHQTLVKLDDGFVMNTQDITDRKKAEQEMFRLKEEVAQKATDKYYTLFNSVDDGFAIIELILDESGKPVDFIYLETNPAFIKHAGVNLQGKRRSEVFSEKKDFLLEKYKQVMKTGAALHFEYNLQTLGTQWFQVTISRIGEEGSKLLGAIFRNITEHKEREQQQAYLLRLSDALRPLADPKKIQTVAADLLGEQLKANQSHYGEIMGDYVYIYHSYGSGLPSMTGKFRHQDFGKRLVEGYRAGIVQVCNDTTTDPTISEAERQVLASAHIGAYISVPLVKNKAWIATLTVHSIEPRQWKQYEIKLVQETAERTWSAVEKAKAEKALRQSEQQLQNFNVLLERQVAERTRALRQSADEVQKSLTILQHTEELAQAGSWEYEIETGHFTWSEGMYRLFGLPQHTAVKPEIYVQYAVKEDKPIARRIVQNLIRTHSPFEEDLCIERKDAIRRLRVKASIVPNKKNGSQKIVGVDVDVTEIKQAEEDLRNLNTSLVQKNNELAQKNEEIISFAYAASHDLREPLRKLNLFNNWLQEKENDRISDEGKNFLTRMNGAVNRMTSLIDDILILSRVQRYDNESAETDLNTMLEKAKAALSETIKEKNAVILSEPLPEVMGNTVQLTYLFSNILSNALKFQPEGAVPHITISATKVKAATLPEEYRQAKAYWKISFTDNGIGFDPKDAQKIFHLFQRLHGLQEYKGTGMGLTIVKKIMENHKGFITAKSQPGAGATFSCYFPLPE